MQRPPNPSSPWTLAGLVALAAGCTEMLPGTDQAFDAAGLEIVAPPAFDAGTDRGPAVTPPAMDAGTDRGPAVTPPAMDAGTDRGPAVTPPPVDRPVPPPVDRPVPPPVDRPAPVDQGAPDTGDDPSCGGEGRGGQPCCSGGRCDVGYLCRRPDDESAPVCLRCGGQREICCAGGQCDGNRECDDGRCE